MNQLVIFTGRALAIIAANGAAACIRHGLDTEADFGNGNSKQKVCRYRLHSSDVDS